MWYEINYLIMLPEKSNLLLGLALHFGPILTETLKLVHKLINHVPQPLVWQLHIHHSSQNHLIKEPNENPSKSVCYEQKKTPPISSRETKEYLEKAAIVVPRIDPLLKSR